MSDVRSILLTFGAALTASALFLSSCGSDKPADGFLIKGKVAKPTPGGFIVLRKFMYADGSFAVIDSVQPDKEGNYKFIGKLPEENFLQLDFFHKQQVLLVGDNKEITVDADGDSPEGAKKLEGTDDNVSLGRMIALKDKMASEVQPMQYELSLAAQNRDEARMNQYIDYLKRANVYYRKRFKSLIDSTGPNIVAWYGTYYLDPEQDFGFMDSLGRQFQKAHPNAAWTKDYLSNLDRRRATALGQPSPAFSLPTPEGKAFGPADLKGKIVLLDFWASWCGPCRQKSPEMRALYERVKGKGVEFLGVSLDTDKGKWVEAIAKDGLAWPHISDLKGWKSEAAQLYRIDQIPTVIVLDRKGNIAAKNLEGAELEKKLEELSATM